jgi:DNA-binding MarR family transcriptional regulator
MDLLAELGSFAFASRLRRLHDRLKAEATMLYHHRGVDFNDSYFLVGYMLSRQDSMSVTEIANALSVSRPAISQMASDMAKQRLITVKVDPTDRRQRLLSLTDRGHEAVEMIEPLWKAVGDVTDELLGSTGHDCMKAMAELERKLDERSLFARVIGRVDGMGHEEASNG